MSLISSVAVCLAKNCEPYIEDVVISWPEETIRQTTYVSVGGGMTGTNALHNICKCAVLKIRAFGGTATAYGLSYAVIRHKVVKTLIF